MEQMSELCFLGTGGSIPRKRRNNASLLLDMDGELVLIDCPGDAYGKIKKLGFDPRNIRSLFITHIHPDHVYGLPALIHSLMLDDMSLLVYGSHKTVRFCKDLLSLFYLLDEKIKCRIQFKPLEEGQYFQIHHSLRASSIRIPHSSSSLALDLYFKEEDLSLLYSGDTPVHEPLFKRNPSPDILIHDCSAPSRFFKQFPSLSKMHTHSLALGKMAYQAGVSFLIPIHFFGELDYSMEEIEREIKEDYRNRLIIPKDLDKIRISRSLLA
jgi:ribonuclease Z